MMKSKPDAVPPGFGTVTPCLSLKDTRKAIAFYKKALGARELMVFPGPDGKGTMHATIQIGDSIIMMGDEHPEQGCRSAESLGGSPIGLYVYVADVDAVFKQAVAAGVTVTMPVDEAFWGDRCGSFKDPFGYDWTIATHTRDLTEEQVREGAEAFFAQMAKA